MNDVRAVVHMKTKREIIWWKNWAREKPIVKIRILDNLYKGVKEFKKIYQARVNVIKNENGEFLADLQSILNKSKD